MSSGLECEFVEYKPGQWYYILERGSAPKVSWDWREYADATGPFLTEEAAEEHLFRNEVNPGGSMTLAFDPERRPDQVLDKLIAAARRPLIIDDRHYLN